ncbi:MAG: hypothetical protein ACFFDD_06250, partial [Promethearchaeota archaeon]
THFISTESWPEFDESFIQEEVDRQWTYFDQTVDDIREIIKILKRDESEMPLERIHLIVADDWKSIAIQKIVEAINENKIPQKIMPELMADESIRPHGKEVQKLIKKIEKDPGKFDLPFTSPDEELQFLKEVKSLLEHRFGADILLDVESTSSQDKAALALPGKPAIVIE